MRNKVFTFILLISCIACNSIPKYATLVEEFPSTHTLQGDSIKNFDSELGIMAILNAGNYFICPSHRTDYHFAVYKKDSLKKICDIFPKGRGAGEFIAPAYFSQCQTEGKETKIWILEQALNQYLKINLSKTISSDSLHIEKTYDLSPFKSYSYRNMYVINDDLLFATRDDQDCRHAFLHLAEKQQQEIDFSLPIPIHPYTHYISQTISAKHPSQPYFVSAYFNFPQIDFINEQGIYKTIFYKEIIQPRQSTLSQSECEYFSCVCCDNNYVYALYNPYNTTEDNYLNTSEVLVFSWQGEAVQKYIIPFATYICIDSENQRLYALNPQKETFNTTVYTLPFHRTGSKLHDKTAGQQPAGTGIANQRRERNQGEMEKVLAHFSNRLNKKDMKTRKYIKWFSSLFFDDCLTEEKKGCKLTIVAKLTSACIPDTPLNIERRHEDRKN